MSDQDKIKQQIKDALTAIQKLKHQLKTEQDKNNQAIAIVGVALRLPGNVNSMQDYWQLLLNNIDAIEDIPNNRFNVDEFYSDKNDIGKINIKQGGYLKDIDLFDGNYFDISRVELESLDPQQRLLLELAVEALENAGININALNNTATGVFTGVTNVDYQEKHFRSGNYQLVNPYSYSGSAFCATSGRISYLLGLQGPSIAIDTACSSSLVATHLACQSLRNHECDMALVGAANLILEPELTMYFSHLNALSATSRCQPFSNDANGFIRSEAAAVIILKRLDDAVQNKDNILATIKGSAINQDGKSNGFTAPSVVAQTKLHQQALQNAKLKPSQISFIEAHGTGTKIGDPIEVEAIANVYATEKSKDNPLQIASVKSNIGHTESVAGLAGMLKVALAMQHQLLPKNLHSQSLNQLINWNELPIQVVQNNSEWKDEEKFAAISGFGVTGTNAQVILSNYKSNNTLNTNLRNDIFIISLSAKSEQALINLTKKYIQFINENNIPLEHIASMTALRRAAYPIRKCFVATTKQELLEVMQNFVDINEVENFKLIEEEENVKIVFVFPGQGAQFINMGKILMQHEPVFKQALEDCNQAFKSYVDWDIFEELNKTDNSRLEEIDIVQPILVAIEISLAKLWQSKGIQPNAVIGHSMGEVAAAYIANIISLEDAAKIICHRSNLMKQVSGKGAMLATDLSQSEAEDIVNANADISIAVINSANSLVLSGDKNSVHQIQLELESKDRFAKLIKVDVASHSKHMDEVKEQLEEKLLGLTTNNTTIDFYSTVVGDKIKGEQLNASYWKNNLRSTVQFNQATQKILSKGKCVFIEMSPHPTLLYALQQNISTTDVKATAIGSFERDKNELLSFYNNVGLLFQTGYAFNWKTIYEDIATFVQLPTYAWQKERYWIDTVSKKSTALNTTKPIDYYKINSIQIDEKLNIQYKNILLFKDNQEDYIVLSNLLQQKDITVTVADINDTIDFSLYDAIIHCRSWHKDDFNLYLECGVLSLQNIVNQLEAQQLAKPIFVITNGSFVLDFDKQVNLNASLLIGLINTIQNEYSNIPIKQIDLPFNFTSNDFSLVLNSLQINENKITIIRQNNIYTNQLELINENQAIEKVHFTNEGTHLITGGTSGLGLELAKYLSQQGATHIALISRSGLKEKTQEAINEIKANGTQVAVLKCDVANKEQLQSTIATIETSMPNIIGVYHAAGILNDGLLATFTKDDFNNIIQTKSIAALHLHELFAEHHLEQFVLFASIASILGTKAQANYNAANAFLNELAAFRRNNNQNAIAINWGNIAEVGLAAADEKRGNALQQMGMQAIAVNELKQCFDKIFQYNLAEIVPVKLDYNEWSNSYKSIKQNAFFANVVEQDMITQQTSDGILNASNLPQAKKNINERIKQFVSKITKIPSNKIKDDATFKSLGIDSLMALQLKDNLQEAFQLQLTVASIWANPTTEKYTNFIANELNLETQFLSDSIDNNISENSATKSVDAMSIEELMNELNSKVNE